MPAVMRSRPARTAMSTDEQRKIVEDERCEADRDEGDRALVAERHDRKRHRHPERADRARRGSRPMRPSESRISPTTTTNAAVRMQHDRERVAATLIGEKGEGRAEPEDRSRTCRYPGANARAQASGGNSDPN